MELEVNYNGVVYLVKDVEYDSGWKGSYSTPGYGPEVTGFGSVYYGGKNIDEIVNSEFDEDDFLEAVHDEFIEQYIFS